jgi:hypothetical protein
MVALTVFVLPVTVAAQTPPTSADVGAAIDKGLAFLAKDAMAWKAEHKCVSCHHAGLVVWAMREAKGRGHTVDEPVLAELTTWIAESGDGKTGVKRPAGVPKAINQKAVWLALGLGADPKPGSAARKGLDGLGKTVIGDQLDNGSWASWPDTRPPFMGTDEATSTLATLALLPLDGDAKAVRDKGVRWLADTRAGDDPQAVALRLTLWARVGRPADEYQPLVKRIRDTQNADGGWAQAKGLASDAWATGQALYALAHAGVKADDPAIARAQGFLVKTQRADGGWPMASRPARAGDTGAKNLIPITGAGSSWAVLGLVRSR